MNQILIFWESKQMNRDLLEWEEQTYEEGFIKSEGIRAKNDKKMKKHY